MTPSFSLADGADVLPASCIEADTANVSGQDFSPPVVSAVRRDQIAPEESFDYFQAQGRIAAERLGA